MHTARHRHRHRVPRRWQLRARAELRLARTIAAVWWPTHDPADPADGQARVLPCLMCTRTYRPECLVAHMRVAHSASQRLGLTGWYLGNRVGRYLALAVIVYAVVVAGPIVHRSLILLATLAAITAVSAVTQTRVVRSLGFHITEFDIGLRMPPTWMLPAKGRRAFDLVVSPWLLACTPVIRPQDIPEIDKLPMRDVAWIVNSPVVVAAICGLGVTAVWRWLADRPVQAIMVAMVAAAVWWLRRGTAMAVLPLLTPAAMGIVGFGVWWWTTYPDPALGTPAYTWHTWDALGLTTAFTASQLLATLALMCAGLTCALALPLPSMPGGKIVAVAADRLLPPRAARRVRVCVALGTAGAVGYLLAQIVVLLIRQ